jgi:hypothetical protein
MRVGVGVGVPEFTEFCVLSWSSWRHAARSCSGPPPAPPRDQRRAPSRHRRHERREREHARFRPPRPSARRRGEGRALLPPPAPLPGPIFPTYGDAAARCQLPGHSPWPTPGGSLAHGTCTISPAPCVAAAPPTRRGIVVSRKSVSRQK